jgi:glycolate oxidase iron-sulfur subunit
VRGRTNANVAGVSYLQEMNYAVVQQCMHCGMCLPTCPTYVETQAERNSPRGRIALMRAIADGKLEATKQFQDEMYFCLGCLACETACPAGVDYTQLFELARAEAEQTQAARAPVRRLSRFFLLHFIFVRQWRLRLLGRVLFLYRVLGVQRLLRATVLKWLPARYRDLEAKTPVVRAQFSPELIRPLEKAPGVARHRVGVLTGCVQDLIYSEVNRDTVDVLLANGCDVVTPSHQSCCGSLHAHNGEYEWAKGYARRLIDQFDLDSLDAIITNAAGCGSHLKHFDRLLKNDPAYAAKARQWVEKVRDISEWLLEIGLQAPRAEVEGRVTYHDAGRVDVVLRQRGHLQSHPAGDGRQASPAQAGPHRRDRRGSCGHGKSRLSAANPERPQGARRQRRGHAPGQHSGKGVPGQ